MPLIVDTFNLLHTGGILPPELAEYGDVKGLVRLLGVSRWRTERVELVCDGSPQRLIPKPRAGSGVVPAPDSPDDEHRPFHEPQLEDHPNVNIRFSGPGREADEVIAMLVRHSTAPRNLTVVSSDAAVLRTARRRKCRTLTSQQFLEQLATDVTAAGMAPPASVRKPPGGLSSDQVEAWMALFDVNEEEAERAAKTGNERPKAQPAQDDATRSGDAETTPQNREIVLPPDVIEEAERLLREMHGR